MMRTFVNTFVVVAVTAAGLAVQGCSPIPEFGEATVEETYQVGLSAADRGDYLVAIEAFRRITTDAPLNELADDALIALADAHRATGDYAVAEDSYWALLSDYPRSPLVPDAEFKLGLLYYDQSKPSALDQTKTLEAIDQLQRFAAAYPAHASVPEAREAILELRSRLAKKLYDSAELYIKMDRPKSARVYFESIAADYGDTPWAPLALLGLARSHAAEGSTALAEEAYDRLEEEYPSSAEAAAASSERAPAE